jgi:membrane-bound lytic murein transglycosylase B
MVATALFALFAVGYVVVLATQPRQPLEIGVQSSVQAPTLEAAPQDAVASPQTATTTTVDPAWVAKTSTLTGIPTVAMAAYASAQLAAPTSCHLGWTTLAAIGWVESHHGTIDGRTLQPGGLPSSPITGIPLGDLDRAYGPMQFIPSTWETWGADANADGTADPQNINDAALAASHYLCASGALNSGRTWSAAVFSYNHSQAYVEQVYSAAQTYAERAG